MLYCMTLLLAKNQACATRHCGEKNGTQRRTMENNSTMLYSCGCRKGTSQDEVFELLFILGLYFKLKDAFYDGF